MNKIIINNKKNNKKNKFKKNLKDFICISSKDTFYNTTKDINVNINKRFLYNFCLIYCKK